MSTDLEQRRERMQAWIDGMVGLTTYSFDTPAAAADRYERLREQYATGSIELEDFTAGVVALLREGL